MPRRKYADIRDQIVRRSVLGDELGPNGEFCWLWIGPTKPGGYGTLTTRWKSGPRKGRVRTLMAHRESVRAFTGRVVRKDYVVRHLCHCRWCVNPNHLVGGTPRQNTQDMLKAGRHWSGFRGPKPKEVAEA
jgi:hypothetical protein